MNKKSILKEARRYADGDGVLVDLERARSLYAEIADSLPDEDLILYRELCALYPHPQGEQILLQYEGAAPAVFYLANRTTGSHVSDAPDPSPEQIRVLLEELLSDADSRMLNKIYSALFKLSNPHASPLKKEENIRFGNNLRVLLFQCDKKASNICTYLGHRSIKISAPAISRKISGQDGTDPETLARILMPFNERWLSNVRFSDPNKHNITEYDMWLPLDEFLALFASPKIDDGLRTLLQKSGIVFPQ